MSAEPEEAVGMGVSMEIPEEIPTAKVWEALLIKIKQPNLFLPVTDVVTRPSDDGLGVYREMSIGPKRIFENIYANEELLEVVFNVIDDDNEHVNIILVEEGTGRRTLEFYKRLSSNKNERVHWDAPKKIGLGGVAKVLEMARTL